MNLFRSRARKRQDIINTNDKNIQLAVAHHQNPTKLNCLRRIVNRILSYFRRKRQFSHNSRKKISHQMELEFKTPRSSFESRTSDREDRCSQVSLADSTESNEFHDAVSWSSIRTPLLLQRANTKEPSNVKREDAPHENQIQLGVSRSHRTTIPKRPVHSLSLWSVIKNSIGKDLVSTSLPVNFNEPLSFLQRLTEQFKFSHLLDKAAESQDSTDQLHLVTAFAIASYSSNVHRTGKPFNPLLCETFECDRVHDLGWRSIAEQVSHHPPISAVHVEGRGWTGSLLISVKSKFNPNSIIVTPIGYSEVAFHRCQTKYKWEFLKSCVYNAIVGNLWIAVQGDLQVENLTNQALKSVVHFHKAGWISDYDRAISGYTTNDYGAIASTVSGNWDSQVNVARLLQPAKHWVRADVNKLLKHHEVTEKMTVWKSSQIASDHSIYGFCEFAVQLNEEEDHVAPTDSRLRPDIRMMENGNYDDANEEKKRLENKQRGIASLVKNGDIETAKRKKGAIHPIWFEEIESKNEMGIQDFRFGNEYWKSKESQDWTKSPDIF